VNWNSAQVFQQVGVNTHSDSTPCWVNGSTNPKSTYNMFEIIRGSQWCQLSLSWQWPMKNWQDPVLQLIQLFCTAHADFNKWWLCIQKRWQKSLVFN